MNWVVVNECFTPHFLFQPLFSFSLLQTTKNSSTFLTHLLLCACVCVWMYLCMSMEWLDFRMDVCVSLFFWKTQKNIARRVSGRNSTTRPGAARHVCKDENPWGPAPGLSAAHCSSQGVFVRQGRALQHAPGGCRGASPKVQKVGQVTDYSLFFFLFFLFCFFIYTYFKK